MSLPDLRLAADGAAYTYADFVQWYGAHAGQMWEGAAATEHSHSRTPQSSDVLPARRIAADGMAYTYTDFVNWYGTHAGQLWERAAATELSESIAFVAAAATGRHIRSTPSPERRFAADDNVGLLGTERGRDATEHSPLENATETQASSSGSNEPRAAVKTICVGDLPRDATEHSPMAASSSTASAQATGCHSESTALAAGAATEHSEESANAFERYLLMYRWHCHGAACTATEHAATAPLPAATAAATATEQTEAATARSATEHAQQAEALMHTSLSVQMRRLSVQITVESLVSGEQIFGPLRIQRTQKTRSLLRQLQHIAYTEHHSGLLIRLTFDDCILDPSRP